MRFCCGSTVVHCELNHIVDNMESRNSKEKMTANTWIALGGLVIAALTCYFTFFGDKKEPVPSQQVNVTVNTELKNEVIPNQSETQTSNKRIAPNKGYQPQSEVPYNDQIDGNNIGTQPNVQKNLKSFELTIIVNSEDKIFINGMPGNFKIGSSATVKKVDIIEGERYEIIIGNCNPIIINNVSKNEKITRCS